MKRRLFCYFRLELHSNGMEISSWGDTLSSLESAVPDPQTMRFRCTTQHEAHGCGRIFPLKQVICHAHCIYEAQACKLLAQHRQRLHQRMMAVRLATPGGP